MAVRALARRAQTVQEEPEEEEEESFFARVWREAMVHHRSFLISGVVHAVMLIVLALWVFTVNVPNLVFSGSMEPAKDDFDLEQYDPVVFDNPEVGEPPPDIIDREDPLPLQPLIDMQNAAEGIDAASVALTDASTDKAPFNDVLAELGRGAGLANQQGAGKGKQGAGFGLSGEGMGMGGRGGRRSNATKIGATPESEAAVDAALKWLADHQMPDGGWSFHHQMAVPCQGQCSAPGEMPVARNAATALGLLPFLGAGQTHQVGKYQKTVAGGLMYLIQHMQVRPQGGSFHEPDGRMYAHGLATIALCEAYAMRIDPELGRRRGAYTGEGAPSPGETKLSERDKAAIRDLNDALGRAAQMALNYVAYAQDPAGGGWRYEPRTPGDTSVVGWQLMAATSGRLAGLAVDPRMFIGANVFLDHVAIDDYGANYGYTDKNQGSQATQAIGLLCRMYSGWQHDHPGLAQGAENLSGMGPSGGNMYYNYYATQVMHHYGGDLWKQWNDRMRDQLVATQSHAGHEAGSWFFGGGDHGSSKGGRLYCTALAAMTLEVYYRHMPLYGKDIFAPAGQQPGQAVPGQPAAAQPGKQGDGDFPLPQDEP